MKSLSIKFEFESYIFPWENGWNSIWKKFHLSEILFGQVHVVILLVEMKRADPGFEKVESLHIFSSMDALQPGIHLGLI